MPEINRENYLRITNVLSPFTGIEFVPSCYLDPAADRGTRVHESIESFIKGFGHSTYEDIQGYIKSFNDFWEKENMDHYKDMTQEKRFYCDNLEITGQVDLIVNKHNSIFIYDWKTSSRPQKSWVLQAAAYKYLYEVENESKVSFVNFVHLKKDGTKAKVIEYGFNDLWDGFETFKKCLELYKYFNMKTTRVKR